MKSKNKIIVKDDEDEDDLSSDDMEHSSIARVQKKYIKWFISY